MQNLLLNNFDSYQGAILKTLLSENGFGSIREFQRNQKITEDGWFGLTSYGKLYNLLLNPTEMPFFGHYYHQPSPKNQIILHHSASADSIATMYHWWRVDGIQHVATAIGIDDLGNVGRGYPEDHWAHHIGLRHWHNVRLNMYSVAVEIMNWGYLSKQGDKYLNYVNREVPAGKVVALDFRGQKFFEAYTPAEIATLRKWILLMSLRYDIPIDYREQDLWNVSNNAINGTPGLFTHCSYISWKIDIVPQPLMVEMLKTVEPQEAKNFPKRTKCYGW